MVDAWPHEDVAALNSFYGDPRGPHGGEASAAWEAANLVHWEPPYPLFYSDGKMSPMLHLRVHRRCLDTFNAAFSAVLAHFGAQEIAARRLNVTGGTYCYRLERGGSRLSVHSWGCAIDLDPGHNPFPSRHGSIDLTFVEILNSHGFWWRGSRTGTSKDPGTDVDPMHFQLTRHV